MKNCLLIILLFTTTVAFAQPVSYPYPTHYIHLSAQGQNFKMAYMDVRPTKPNGETILLLHGKNFNGYYWKEAMPALLQAGYRLIVPDQIGWGKSDKPVIQYSFGLLAYNTRSLLDSLHINKVNVIGHSMGGMLASRFSVMYADVVKKLTLENPIGLEDYSLFVPYQPIDTLYKNEEKTTFESMKQYQKTYYPEWKPDYEQYVQAQWDAYANGDKANNALVNALTYQVIMEQPVVYYFQKVKAPVLLIIGQADRTVVGKNLLTAAQKQQYGNYPTLGRAAQRAFPNATLVELKDVGHIPHLQATGAFTRSVISFLKK